VVTATQSNSNAVAGTVTFFVCDPTQTTGGACPSGGTQVGLTAVTVQPVSGSDPPAATADSAAVTVNKTGTWCFRAVFTSSTTAYSGSSDASSGECFTVTDTTASTSAQNWLPNDAASVSSVNGALLNGMLSAQLYTNGDCGVLESGQGAVPGQVYTATLTNAASPGTLTTSNKTFTVPISQSVSWLVTFASSDPNVQGSSHCESTSLTINNNQA
jgi:hypothetical protein